MPEFIYRASDRAGKIVDGSIEAGDESAVIAKLRGMGLIPIRIQPATAGNGLARSLNLKFSFAVPALIGRVSNRELLAFTQELATLVKASLPLDRSLSIVAEITDNEHLKAACQEILKDVRSGKSFSEALVQHPRIFNRLYVNMIKAGETGGVLDVVLDRLVDFLERSQELRNTIINALIYPLVLISVMGVVISIMLVFVIPRFVSIFEMMGQKVPLPTQILLAFSTMVKDYWWLMATVVVGCVYSFRTYTARESGRLAWDRTKLKIAGLRTLILKIEVARFSRTLGTLITSGVPILQALAIVKEIIGNTVIANSLAGIQRAVKEGKGISLPMRSVSMFPSLALHMIRVGEETGRLEEMLIKVAETYDKDVQHALKRFISFLEPALILVMSLLVGFIVLSIIWAIFSINDISF